MSSFKETRTRSRGWPFLQLPEQANECVGLSRLRAGDKRGEGTTDKKERKYQVLKVSTLGRKA